MKLYGSRQIEDCPCGQKATRVLTVRYGFRPDVEQLMKVFLCNSCAKREVLAKNKEEENPAS